MQRTLGRFFLANNGIFQQNVNDTLWGDSTLEHHLQTSCFSCFLYLTIFHWFCWDIELMMISEGHHCCCCTNCHARAQLWIRLDICQAILQTSPVHVYKVQITLRALAHSSGGSVWFRTVPHLQNWPDSGTILQVFGSQRLPTVLKYHRSQRHCHCFYGKPFSLKQC